MPDPLPRHTGLDCVRHKPGRYIGGTDARALMVCVMEVVGSALQEHLAGRGARIAFTMHNDASLSVQDAGGGIPVENDSISGAPFIATVFTTLNHPGTHRNRSWPGPPFTGVATQCVNAASESMRVETVWEGIRYRIGFRRGQVRAPLQPMPHADGAPGTLVQFK